MKKKNWINKTLNDKYSKIAKIKKLRSRSWFKIQEIHHKYNIFNKNDNTIDLGCSPGGWSKFISKKIKNIGKIFSCDILPMKKIKNVNFILGDICNLNTINKLIKITKSKNINNIISDISPNISGIKEIDNPKYKKIIKNIIYLYKKKLYKNGNIIIKVFLGEIFIYILKKIKKKFKVIKIYKPQSSYNFSKEIYIIALKYKKH